MRYRACAFRRWLIAALGLAFIAGASDAVVAARAAEKMTFLYAALPSLPAYGQIQLARGKGYFEAEGLDVSFAVGKGGVDVAKQLGAGNADIGMVLADSPIIVRPNGVPVKTVALFGGHGFMQLVVRADAGIASPADLKGKKIGVMSFQDTTFYALQGVLASAGMSLRDVQAEALGPATVWKMLVTGDTQACACVPDWIPLIEDAGTKLQVLPSDKYFPTMAQALGVSDAVIKARPGVVRAFVRAALHGMKDIMDDPKRSAAEFVSFVPEMKGKEDYVERVFAYYATVVFPGQTRLGLIDEKRLEALQDFYVKQGIVRTKTPLDELYTNAFVPAH